MSPDFAQASVKALYDIKGPRNQHLQSSHEPTQGGAGGRAISDFTTK